MSIDTKMLNLIYEELFKQSFKMIFILDGEQTIVHHNNKVVEIFGKDAKDLNGKKIQELSLWQGAHEREKIKTLLIKAREKNESLEQLSIKNSDGKQYYFSVIVNYIEPEAGAQYYLFKCFDITNSIAETEPLKLSEARLERAQKIAHLGNWEWNVETNDLIWSDEVFRIFDDQPQSYSPTLERFMSRVHKDDQTRLEIALKISIEQDAPYDLKHRITCADGSIKMVHERGTILRDTAGNPKRMDGTILDITEMWLTEKALIEERNKANAADKAKTQFLRAISHELRTPLNGILGFSKILSDPSPHMDEGKKAYFARHISATGESLLALINNVIDTARIDIDNLTAMPCSFDIMGVVEQALKNNQLIHSNRQNVRVTHNLHHSSVFLDKQLCGQIFTNLLSNAYKFTHNTIHIDQTETNDNICFTIIDNGVGIPIDIQDTILKPFSTLSDEMLNNNAYGAGLGLTVVNAAVKAHDGQFALCSTPGEGTTVRLTLPREMSLTNVE